MSWYYTDNKQEVMCCSLCIEDDKFSVITSTLDVAKMPQTVICKYCNWCPKADGLTRPETKTSGHKDKINIYKLL